MSYDTEQLRRIIEGAIMAAGEALSVDKLHGLFEEHEAPEKSEIKDILQLIADDYEGRGFQLVEVASGWRFQVREDVATWVNRLWEEKPQKYSRALLETLALIAYRQPITRGDIEDVRGVAVSSQIIRTLVEREWVKVVGHRDVPGRPSLYATTRQFLDYFNLKSLDELPTLSELKDIDSINGSLDLSEDVASDEGAEPDAGEEGVAAADTPDDLEQQAAQVYDPDEGRELDTSMAGDGLVEDEHDEAPVQEANIPFELDEEVSQPKDDSIPDAEPTVEQEELAEAEQDDETPAADTAEHTDQNTDESEQERPLSDDDSADSDK
jgi:segregation and condensation protein B